MDKKINAYLESLVAQGMTSVFANLLPEQKTQMAEKIRNYLYDVLIDTVLEHLSLEQLDSIKKLPVDSPEMEIKITEYSSTIPNLAKILEEKLNQAVVNVKQNPQILSTSVLTHE